MAEKGFLSRWLFFSGSSKQLLTELTHQIDNSRSTTYIFTPNPEQLVLAQFDADFAQTLAQADYLLPDGIGVIWGARWLARKGLMAVPQERLTGTDTAAALIELATKDKKTVGILGGRGYADRLSQRWPDLTVAWTPGYAQVAKPTLEEEKAVLEWLAATQPALLFVAFGAPWQERWAVMHRAALEKYQVKVVMVVGGAFDSLLGLVPRAPRAMRRWGLEWLYRLIRQPWRWRRQLKLLTFARLVAQEYYSGS